MNKHFLKKIRDTYAGTSEISIAAPLIRNRLIKNKEFLKYYNLLENRELSKSGKNQGISVKSA